MGSTTNALAGSAKKSSEPDTGKTPWIEDYETYLDFPHAEARGCLYNNYAI
jgi:hypothetical protein